MPKVIEVELPDGHSRRVAVEPTSKAGEVTGALDMSGFLLVTSDGRKLPQDQDIYGLVEHGEILTLSRSLTGGKGAAGIPFDLDDPALSMSASRGLHVHRAATAD